MNKKKAKPTPTDLLDQVAKAKNMKPFRPFVLHLTSGENIGVPRDEDIAINRHQNVMFIFGEEQNYILTPKEVAGIVTPHL
jgi:hypothetical protein